MAHLLAIDEGDVRQYWTGEVYSNGTPIRTLWKGLARHFTTARAAYEAAGTHECLRLSEEWKAVPR